MGSHISTAEVSSADTPAPSSGESTRQTHGIDLAVVLPTFNERKNVGEILSRLENVLRGLTWEVIFVDDDSPDGTADLVRYHAQRDPRVRLVHRVGRRGLASACIEGIMASSSDFVAIMDADLQHDETILPRMLDLLQIESLDVVVGTRNAAGGSMGQFSSRRVFLSRLGEKISQAVCHCKISDPMSGFFLLNRAFFMENVHELQGGGFKILVDVVSSSKRPVRVGEVGYSFRNRVHGDSKLDFNAAIEYLFLIINKVTGGLVPTRFAVFSLVGATGLIIHLACLSLLMLVFHRTFLVSQIAATIVAMTGNFFLNNLITYRDRKLRGVRLFTGVLSFWLACSFGAWANVTFARAILLSGAPWFLAGLAGVVISSVWNYSMTSLFTWQMPQRRRKHTAVTTFEAVPTPTKGSQ